MNLDNSYVLYRSGFLDDEIRAFKTEAEAQNAMIAEFKKISGYDDADIVMMHKFPYYFPFSKCDLSLAEHGSITWLIYTPDEVERVEDGYILGFEEHFIPHPKSQVINGIIASMTVTNSKYHSDKTGNYYTAQLMIPDKESLVLIYDEDDDQLTIGNWYVLGELLIKAIYDKIVSAIIETAA